jgi:hypothetical protein
MADQLRNRCPGHSTDHVPVVRLVLGIVAVPVPEAVDFPGPLALYGLAKRDVLARAGGRASRGGCGRGGNKGKGKLEKQMEKQRATIVPPRMVCGHVPWLLYVTV